MHNDQRARGNAAAPVGDPAAGRSTDGPSRIEDHQTGRLLDHRYRIGSRIARGGMASVYEAIDSRLDRTVAVKIMHPGLGESTATGDESFARRFVREARAAAGLSHPNVVAVYDQGRDDDGTVYLVMEYVPGHTLRDTIAKEAPMSPERALTILEPILSALASAHRAGLVHRDIKPENVLIGTDPHSGASRVKVADFGLAKAVTADTQHTATNGVLIGTVSYLAPELVVEQRADARADVYAVGVILFELLTGTKPHTGETPIAVAYRHVHHDVPAPSSLVASTPAYVDALVARATSRDPSLRPSDASVLLHHVRRVGQALRDGVREDPELFDDLMPSARNADETADTAERDRVDTTPEPVASMWAGIPGLDEDTGASPPVRRAPPPPATPTPPRREQTSVFGRAPEEPAPPAGPPRRRRWRRIVIPLVLVLLLGTVAAGGYWYGWGRYLDTPRVVGLEQAAATTLIEDADLEVEVGEQVHSESIAKGLVVSTDPGPGARILPGETVQLTVSLGPERYDVPDLTNLTVDEATAALAEVRFVVGRQSEKFSETIATGRVIRSKPRFGAAKAKNLPVDTAVAIVVSKGPKPIKVGNWVDKDADDAEKVLEERGLRTEVVGTEYSDDVPEGHVISQAPTSGTLFRGDTVEFVVSKGPELVTVPGVRLMSKDDAVAKLEGLGFKVKLEKASIYINGNYAWDTNPKGGTRARKGSTIILYVV